MCVGQYNGERKKPEKKENLINLIFLFLSVIVVIAIPILVLMKRNFVEICMIVTIIFISILLLFAFLKEIENLIS